MPQTTNSTAQIVLSRSLSPELRITLDVIRALAAGYVVLHHLAIRSEPGIIEPFLRFGQEAVMAFFLLSGFVIHANERHRVTQELPRYLLRRGLRIYPTLVIAMAISAGIALAQGEFAQKFTWQEAVCTVFALQDAGALKPGTLCSPFMGNAPLWSLSYELVFYAAYPLILPLFLRAPKMSQHLIGITTLVLILSYARFPSHFLLLPSYFLIWWGGAMMAERCLNPAASRDTVVLPLAYLCAAVFAWAGIAAVQGIDRVGTYPVLMLRHFTIAVLLLFVALTPAGSWAVAHIGRNIAWRRRLWGWASSISYGVYVIHFPILIQWQLANTWQGFALALLILIVISDLADRRVTLLIRRLLGSPKKEAATCS